MFFIFITWLITTLVYGALGWIAIRRVVKHLRGNEVGMRAVVEHVLLPMLGKERTDEEPKPATDDGKKKGMLV